MVRTDFWSDLFGSSSDSLQKTIEQLTDVSFPSVGSEEFQEFWRVSFGFAVVVSIFALVLSLLTYAKSKDMKVLLDASITFVGTFIVGYFLPPLLYLATWTSKRLALFVAELSKVVQENETDPWYQIVNAVNALGNPIKVLGNRVLGDIVTGTLEWLVTSVVTCLFFFAFLTLVTWPIRRIGFGFTLYRFGLAGLITSVALQPLVILVLVLGAIGLKLTGTDVGNLNNSLSVILLIACLMPFILFFYSFRKMQKIQIEGPVAVNSGGSFGPFRGVSLGHANSRPYAGKIPQAGDTMERVAGGASWIGEKFGAASRALSAVRPEAAAAVGGIAVAAQAVGDKASARAESRRSASLERGSVASSTDASVDGENRTLSGAVVTAANDYNQSQPGPSAQSDAPAASGQPVESSKPPRGTAIRQGASNVAAGAATAAQSFEKAARWTSGAQRRMKSKIDEQLRR